MAGTDDGSVASAAKKFFLNLSSFSYTTSNISNAELNELLDQFNGLNDNFKWTDNSGKSILAINQLCNLIPSSDKVLASKTLKLFTTLLTKQNVQLEGASFEIAVQYCLDCLSQEDTNVKVSALSVLQILLSNENCKLDDLGLRIIQICREIMKNTKGQEAPNVFFNCIKCIECLVSHCDTKEINESILDNCIQLFFGILYDTHPMENPVILYKCYITAICGIGSICQVWSQFIIDKLPHIMGVGKGYMLFGLPDQEYLVEKVLPTQIPLREALKPTQTVRKLKGKYDKSGKKKTTTPMAEIQENEERLDELFETLNLTASDSEISDTESGPMPALRSLRSKVRHSALSLIGALFQKGDRKILASYLPALLPDSALPQSRNLLTSLLKDPSPKCRSEVLVILYSILDKYKPLLSLASSEARQSFTAFSNTLAFMLAELHRALVSVLISEHSRTIITFILKTISNLVRCTPYHKMESGILTQTVKHIRSFLKNSDLHVQMSALSVFGCVASLEIKTTESNLIVLGQEGGAGNKPVLFQICLDFLSSDDCKMALAVESLQVLSALARNYFRQVVVTHPGDVIKIITSGVNNDNYQIRLYSAKLLEAVAGAMQIHLSLEDESQRIRLSLAKEIWMQLISGPLTSLLQCIDKPCLRSSACEAISRLGGPVKDDAQGIIFDELPRGQQIIVITQTFGCISDDDITVQTSAIRALAVLVQFPNLRRDSLFFMDVVDVFHKIASCGHSAVRIQAAWLFGNLTDAAFSNHLEECLADLGAEGMTRLLITGGKLATDIAKIRPNAVRGLGNLLRITNAECYQQIRGDVENGLDILVSTATSASLVKARWNACYAIGNAIKNPAISLVVRTKAFPVLCDLIKNDRNFKVRIAAGQAISSFPDRDSYGEVYIETWAAILSGLENAQTTPDSEFMHREQLIMVLGLGMCHLIAILTRPDLRRLRQFDDFEYDWLKTRLLSCRDKIPPENSTVMLDAEERLTELKKMELDGEEKAVVQRLYMLVNNIYDLPNYEDQG